MRLLRFAATTATTLAIATGGVAGIVGASSVSNSGPKGHVTLHASNHQDTKNDNKTNATNENWQTAGSGDVKVKDNTTNTGDNASGAATNENVLDASVTNDNSGSCGCEGGSGSGVMGDALDVTNTGPKGNVKVDLSNSVHVNNNNNTTIKNENKQSAKSGDVTVKDNTTAGGATSGDAMNSNTATITVKNTN